MIHRKRGLLYPLLPSRSYADAWIEIEKSICVRHIKQSRSYADAWIEILLLRRFQLRHTSRSYADAWIEIPKRPE